MDGAILDVGLVGEVVRRLDRNLHPLDGQESCQVRRVGGDDDQGEGPPARKRTLVRNFLTLFLLHQPEIRNPFADDSPRSQTQ